MEADKEITIRCDCGDSQCHLNIGRFDDDEPPILYVTVSNVEGSLWYRLKLAWNVLIYGSAVLNEIVILKPEPIERLMIYLTEALDDWKFGNGKAATTTADGAVTYTFSGKG